MSWSAELRKYIVYGLAVFATLAAVWLAATDGQGGGPRLEALIAFRAGKKKSRDSYRSKATAQVNDRYFISDVTSYAAGNFTAAGSGFFKGWTYNDVGTCGG